jgi:FkbM family methyltransferase
MAMQKYANEIYCYEPNQTHFECLIKNLETYQNVKLYNHAVGNHDGKIRLTEDTATQNTRVLLEEGDTVICKLDFMDLKNPDMLKIDVEGFEMEVLKGGEKILDNIEFVMIELNNNSKKYGSSNSMIEKHMKKLGFKVLIKTWPDIVYTKA